MENSANKALWLSMVSLSLVILVALAIAGVRYKLVPLGGGLLTVGVVSVLLLGYSLVATVVLVIRWRKRQPMPPIFWVSWLLGFMPFAAFLAFVGTEGLRAPAIHDITTDWETPPELILTASLRGTGDHPVKYQGGELIETQLDAYPDIGPLFLEYPADQVLAAAKEVADSLGWQITGVRHNPLALEAVSTSRLFGFKDDVAVRVVAIDSGRSRVDIRSASRVGQGDLGANATRVRVFQRRLEEIMLAK